jgi:solute carrier family 25 uncoupling protein 8/9
MYTSSFDCYKKIYAEGGIGKLWTGWGPNVIRNSVINAAELASYDQYKEMVIGHNLMREGIPCHVVCATLAGCTAVVFGSPVDVLKTRIMNSPTGMYSNPVDCAIKTMRNEGPLAFYKGFGPNCVRLASWNVIMFLTLE